MMSCTENIIALILQWMALSPNAPAVRDADYRAEIATAICAEAEEHDIPPALLASMAFYESSFDSRAVGKIGEVGLLQVHGAAAVGCDLDTVAGQVACGAAWLARWRDACPKVHGWEQPLIGYASGACGTSSMRLIQRVKMRLRKAGLR
jgi:hypothetical protein